MTPRQRSSESINVIDGDGTLVSEREQVDDFMRVSGLSDAANEYAVVGILGCQSSGKSTLLNMCFGTHFDVLDASKGRSMTTKGVWFGSSPMVDKTVILDLEGSDSANKGDDRGTFERQSALFALALAEVLIINTWESDVGRHVASNRGILSTVFEANLQLFAHNQNGAKTTLLFLTRDHDESVTPMSRIQDQTEEDIGRIWGAVSKPDQFKDSPYTDFFQLEFYSLPHKHYKADEFLQGIDELRLRFSDESHRPYYFGSEYHFKKSVPAESLGAYCSQIWKSIKEHKDLNIPSERKMLAFVRCDQIGNDISARFATALEPLAASVSSGIVVDFASRVQDAVDVIMQDFRSQTRGYDDEIVAEKFLDCRNRALEAAHGLFLDNVNHARQRARYAFVQALPEKMVDHYHTAVAEARQKAMDQFSDSVRQFSAVPGAEWKTDSVEAALEKELQDEASRGRIAQIKLVKEACKNKIRSMLDEAVVPILDKSDDEMWAKLGAACKDAVQKCSIDVVQPRLEDLVGESDSEALQAEFKRTNVECVRATLYDEMKLQSAYCKNKMHATFDLHFRRGPNGTGVRIWKLRDEPQIEFNAAVEQAFNVLDRYTFFQLDDDVFSIPNLPALEPKELLSGQKKKELKLQFRDEVASSLIQAEDDKRRAQTGFYDLALIAVSVLVFYEWAKGWIYSPFGFFFVIVVGVLIYMMFRLHMQYIVFNAVREHIQSLITLIGNMLTPDTRMGAMRARPLPRERFNGDHNE